MIVASRSVSAGDMPGRGLVEQQQPRLRGQRDRHLELALLAVRERGGRPRADALEPDAREQRLGLGAQRARAAAEAAAARRPCAAAAPAARSRVQLSAANRLECWNVWRDAEPHAQVLGEAGDVAAVEAHRARVDTGSAPRISLNSVLLPAPLGPISPCRAPASSRRSTPSTARRPPKRALTPSSSSSAVIAGPGCSRAAAPAIPPRQQVDGERRTRGRAAAGRGRRARADLRRARARPPPRRGTAPTASPRRR